MITARGRAARTHGQAMGPPDGTNGEKRCAGG